MPYIKSDRALELLKDLHTGLGTIRTKGELNYLISYLINQYIVVHGLNYQAISDAINAALDAAAEARRRVLNPYEDLKLSDLNNVDPYKVLDAELFDLEHKDI